MATLCFKPSAFFHFDYYFRGLYKGPYTLSGQLFSHSPPKLPV